MAKVAWGCYTVRSFFQAQHQGFCYNQSGHLHGEPTGFLLLQRFPTVTHTRSPRHTHAGKASLWQTAPETHTYSQLRNPRIASNAPHTERFATEAEFRQKNNRQTFGALPQPELLSLSLCSAVTDKIRLR